MRIIQLLLFTAVSFLASVIGAVCGIGGGVIIKPALDLLGWASVSSISFLSGCTVLSMSFYSVSKSILSGEKSVDMKIGTPLALGAAFGGVAGKQMFNGIRGMYENQNMVGGVQAGCLAVITVGTLVYVVNKRKVRSRNIHWPAACLFIGFALGMMSGFLGIGGGPVNLVVLFYFFGMDTKTAAANSLYIILFSQITSLITTFVTKSVPDFEPVTLLLMAAGGIGGGMAGRRVNKRIEGSVVDKLFVGVMVLIIVISVYNMWNYFC